MSNIDNIRERIDVIDDQFTQLFVERMELCKQIGEEKAKNNLPLNVYERERQILSRVSAPYKDEMKRYVKHLY
ncbi:MAG: chorismate mutase, partial [Clostridia bacterium]|nr:chorismate mutase [Clostridia bacterium]